MPIQKLRSLIALVIICFFMITTCLMAIIPLIVQSINPNTPVMELSKYADFFSKISGVYTGIIGVIIGYYFGRSEEAIKVDNDNKTVAPKKGR